MNEDNLPRAFKKIISFAIFTLGILTSLFGVYLLIESFTETIPYKIEGAFFVLLGIICAYLADQSILNTKRNDMLKEMIKENKVLSQQQKGGGGILGSLFSNLGIQGNPMFSNVKIIKGSPEDFEEELDAFGFGNFMKSDTFNDPSFKYEVEKLMKKENLTKEDATTALLLESKTLDELKQAQGEAADSSRYELATYIKKMISKREKNGGKP